MSTTANRNGCAPTDRQCLRSGARAVRFPSRGRAIVGLASQPGPSIPPGPMAWPRFSLPRLMPLSELHEWLFRPQAGRRIEIRFGAAGDVNGFKFSTSCLAIQRGAKLNVSEIPLNFQGPRSTENFERLDLAIVWTPRHLDPATPCCWAFRAVPSALGRWWSANRRWSSTSSRTGPVWAWFRWRFDQALPTAGVASQANHPTYLMQPMALTVPLSTAEGSRPWPGPCLKFFSWVGLLAVLAHVGVASRPFTATFQADRLLGPS